MDSTLTLIGSIVIGGIFLLGLLTFHGDVIDHSYEKTFEMLTQETTASLMEIIEHDFRKIGSGLTTPAFAIADTNKITFRGDVNEDSIIDTVRYTLSEPSAVSSTPNPKDRILYRYENGMKTLEASIGVTEFNVAFLDFFGNATTELMNIWQVEVSLTIESLFMMNGKYAKTVWRKRFTPNNLCRNSINNAN